MESFNGLEAEEQFSIQAVVCNFEDLPYMELGYYSAPKGRKRRNAA